MPDVVQDGAVVSLAYTLKLANGEVIDYSEVDDPLEYLHGAENIIPGLERELTGLHVGDARDAEVQPADAYGDYDPDEVEVVERAMLPKDMPLQLGTVLAIQDDEGNLSEAVVRAISAKDVTLDFNHPLAGQKLYFSVQVLAVREASEEELAHGHPHGPEGEEDFDEFDFEDFEDMDDDFDEDLEDEEDYEEED
jgi:FKBP-type peptidyl-prolyl cis-trans isomerase SlyD